MSTRTGPTVNISAVTTFSAALAVLLTSTAFAGVVADARWLMPAALTVGLVSCTGLVGRSLRWWPPLVVLTQLVALLSLLAITYSGKAFLGLLPGPAAIAELANVVSTALGAVREGVAPVPAEPALQCLVCLGLGLVAVLVDAIAVAAGTPAVAGLVLLCVFAVPASLADDMLPWWTFAGGAAGFTLLLTSGGHHRRWNQREPRDAVVRTMFSSPAAMVTATAAVFALLTGAAFTGVGTEGRLPGSDPDNNGSATGGIGLRPFTSLRGQLDRDRVVELFRVRGLPENAYLRAMTLRKFDPQRGWELEGLTQGINAKDDLPPPDGTRVLEGTKAHVEIKPVGYRDPWLPVFGTPTKVSVTGADWHYDPAAGIVFTQTPQDSKPYSEDLVLPDPTPEELRNAQGPVAVNPAYLDIRGIPPEIIALAERITTNDRTKFDQAVALNRYFTDPANGFVYDLNTAPPSGGDGLSDFLLRGKRGFCEQYASSMAVLLRSVGIPARVAVGFTPGHRDGDERVITTNDAHAWVEAYFPGHGWTTFDPTPLDDGRGTQAAAPGEPPRSLPQPPPPAEVQAPPPGQPQAAPDGGNTPAPGQTAESSGIVWTVLGLLVLVLAIMAVPAGLREGLRRQRLRRVTEGVPGSAGIAWREVLDESRDRRVRPAPSDTARKAAALLIDQHELDERGASAMRSLVHAVEHEWYAPEGAEVGEDLPDSLREVVENMRRHAPLDWRARLLPRSVVDHAAGYAETAWLRLGRLVAARPHRQG